jgi:ATP-dependent DNA helicase RecG
MNREQLERLVAEGESNRQEFKKTTGDLKGGMETLCGFLNEDGGRVFFGVTEAGKILGQDIADSTLQEVAREIARIEPPASLLQTRVPFAGTRDVLILETTDRSQSPYTYKGRPYRRVGTTTSIMPQAEYERRLLERGHPARRWENQAAERYRLKHLDTKEVRRAVADAVAAGRLESPVTNPTGPLEKLKLLEDGRLSQAAVVAFAKEMLPDYPQCGLRLARFRGTSKDEFLDQRQLTGHAFQLLREADLFLKRHLPVAGRFEPGVLERLDEPLFPPLALREALVNALCHRDYSVAGGAVSVAIFDDRLEISSTGLLPFGLQVEDLKRNHQSQPRNPLIANVFYLRGLIERWGRGTQKIVELCVQAGRPEPEFEESAGEVVVRFLPSGYMPPHRVSHDLTERQRRILHHLRDGQKRRLSQIMAGIGVDLPPSTLRDDLILMRSLGLVESLGAGRSSAWRLKASQG